MPYLTLSLRDFRNLQNDRIDLNAKEVFFVGRNGQGKTALLEALYYSAYGASFRTHKDTEAVKHGTESFSISALYEYGYSEDSSLAERVDINFGGAGKKIERNGKQIKDRKELISTVSCVLFCHDDMRFATGLPEFKRFFLNQSLSMCDALYLDDLRSYNKVLKSRNALLHQISEGVSGEDMLDIFDVQLAEKGLVLQKKRQDMVFEFNGVFTSLYKEVSGIDGVSLLYRPSWKEDGKLSADAVINVLSKSRERDKAIATTMTGPHRDRLEVVISDATGGKRAFIPMASTGQLRLIALLLRVAQAKSCTKATGRATVLLMDDVMLELDTDKRQILTQMLGKYDQLFCTFLCDEPYQKYQKPTTMIYHIENGVWHCE